MLNHILLMADDVFFMILPPFWWLNRHKPPYFLGLPVSPRPPVVGGLHRREARTGDDQGTGAGEA